MKSSRSAYSLIELVIAVNLVVVVMTISATLFTTLMRSERNALRSAAAQQTLSRLDDLFRRDVHRAQLAEISDEKDEPPTLTLRQSAGESVRYTCRSGELERIAEGPGEPHREVFRIPEATWKIAISGEDAKQVELILNRPADTVTQTNREFAPSREWRLLATLSLTPPVSPAGVTP